MVWWACPLHRGIKAQKTVRFYNFKQRKKRIAKGNIYLDNTSRFFDHIMNLGVQAMYRRMEIRSGGNVREIIVTAEKGKGRGRRTSAAELSPAQKAAKRYRESLRKLSRLINANFSPGDLFLTLTFRGKRRPKAADAEKLFARWIRELRQLRKVLRLGELKYIAVMEQAERLHIHVLLNDMSVDDVSRIWEHGKVIASRLEKDGEYTGIAHYVTKEGQQPNKRRWRQSQNLRKPEVTERKISAREAGKEIEVPKGWKVALRICTEHAEWGVYRYVKLVKVGWCDMAMGREVEWEQEE